MPPKDPTRAQLSSRLTYQANKPAFLQKLQNKMAGIQDDDDDDEDEFEYVGEGREPIPRRPRERPPIPERPADNPGSEDEDGADEKPQVVVLKEGKHLTEREAENIRRKEKGLPPLPEETALKDESRPAMGPGSSIKDAASASTKASSSSLSFSSGGPKVNKSTKRKALGQPDADDDKPSGKSSEGKKKKAKKEKKTLLSFGDDA